MENREIVKNLRKLAEIKPSTEWLDLTRDNFISQINWEKRQGIFNSRPTGFLSLFKSFQTVALAACFLIIFVGGPWLTVVASQVSLPGEFLYPIKRVAESIQSRIASKEKQSKLQIGFANRRLEEFAKLTRGVSGEKDKETKKVINDLKDNLAGVSASLRGISKEDAITMAKETIKIKEDINRAKEKASVGAKESLIEAEKAIEELNGEILAVLTGEIKDKEGSAMAPTSTEEILIFLEKTDSGAMTTTNKVINGVEEGK
jgi:hypothetical protein